MSRPGFAFSTTLRVRYSEIDGQRVVFNSRYLEYADVAVTEFWRWLKLAELGPVWTELEFHMVKATVEYKAPFVLDDMIEIFVRTERVGNSSFTTRMDLCHAETGALHNQIETVSVCVDLATHRPIPVPDSVRERLLGGTNA